jgi:hypothetical protein
MAPFLNYFVCGAAAFVSSTSSSCKNHNGKTMTNVFAFPLPSTTSSSLHATTQELSKRHGEPNLSRLISLLGGSPSDLLRLYTRPEGIRGVYLNKAVQQDETLLRMPLASCLRDDVPPSWLEQPGDKNDSDDGHQAVQIQGWVTRLAASLLHAQDNADRLPEGIQEWLDLLPKSLKESLPVYWSESTLQSTNCRPLELAVDSAFFARADPLIDLSSSNQTEEQIERALDLVQTRACRCSTLEASIDESSSATSDLRVLVPVFDMINHHYEPNAEFFRHGDSMVVRAVRDIEADEEVMIHYGSATMPVWKSLFSYGFVPSVEEIYEHNAAEIVVDNYRFEVSPTEIPFELVQYQAQKLGYEDLENVEFTPEIGHAIVKELEASASALVEESATEDDPVVSSQETLQLVSSLKESHRRTLLTCAGGLREFVEEQ